MGHYYVAKHPMDIEKENLMAFVLSTKAVWKACGWSSLEARYRFVVKILNSITLSGTSKPTISL